MAIQNQSVVLELNTHTLVSVSSPDNLHLLKSIDIASLSPENSTIDSPSILSTQPHLQLPRKSNFHKADEILVVVQKEFRLLRAFLDGVFHVHEYCSQDHHTATHHSMVTAFLKGESAIQVYPDSQPNIDSEYIHEKVILFTHNSPKEYPSHMSKFIFMGNTTSWRHCSQQNRPSDSQ
jgi:hypothetical protein